MATDVFETSKATLTCTVVRGDAAGKKGTLTVKRNGAEKVKEEANLPIANGQITLDVDSLPLVKATEDFWTLTYEAKVDSDTYPGPAPIKVWPLKVTIKAKKENADCPGVPFVFTQKGVAAPPKSTGPDGVLTYFLTDPGEFSVAIGDSFRVVKWVKETGRDREVEVDDRITADFESPAQPAEKKQYVNLDTTTNGADGNGHLVKFVVFAVGPGNTKAGKRGNKCFVEVTFGMEDPPSGTTWGSARSTPKRELKATGVKSFKEVDGGKKYTGYVELAADAGTATFEIEMGVAGGDNCTVKIGGTPECKDAKREFVNWRKLYYEIMAPDFMPLEDNGGKKDLPAKARTHLATRGKKIFLDYEIAASHTFTKAEAETACPGSVFKGDYFGGDAGKDVYLLTDHTFTKYPKAFSKAKAPRVALLKLCQVNYFWDGNCAIRQPALKATAKRVEFPLATGYFVAKSAKTAGGDAVKSVKWWLDLTADERKSKLVQPTLELPATVSGPEVAEEEEAKAARKAWVKETLQNKKVSLEFAKPMIGNIATTLSSTEQAKLDAFVDSCLNKATLDGNGWKAKFEIGLFSGSDPGGRRKTRFDNLKKAIKARFEAKAPTKSTHPAIPDDGTNPAHDLPITVVKPITNKKFAVDLPDADPADPGNLVGPSLTADKCPIAVSVEYEEALGGLGLSGQGAQAGENLCFFNPDAQEASVDVTLHELAHTIGMTFHAGGKALPAGMTMPPLVTANGTVYNGHKHSGYHCANGIAEATRSDPTVQDFRGMSGNCVMFGENTGTGATKATEGFCENCRPYMKAVDLSSL